MKKNLISHLPQTLKWKNEFLFIQGNLVHSFSGKKIYWVTLSIRRLFPKWLSY